MIEILKKYHIHAKKQLGQNFLLEENILQEIAEIISVQGKNILEIGPGFWALTEYICKKEPASLTCIEFDADMISVLQKRIQNQEIYLDNGNIVLIQKDVLQYIPDQNQYSVIANIPYYITSPILQHFLYSPFPAPTQMVILMQKEVCERITSGISSVLSLLVQKKWTVQSCLSVPRHAFSPVPKVDSQVLQISSHTQYDFLDDAFFIRTIKQAFSHPRKKLISNLSNAKYKKSHLQELILSLWWTEYSRAEDFSIDQYVHMCQVLQEIQKKTEF